MKRSVVILFAGLLFCLPLISSAFSSEHPGCAGDCRECHHLEKKDVEGIIKKINPGLTVLDVKLAPVSSLWQIDVETGDGKRGPIFLDFSKKHLLVIQQIIPVDSIGQPAGPPKKVEFSRLPLKDALVMGPRNAKKKVAVFTDPDCPFCRKLHVELKKVLEQRHDVAFYIFLRPLPMHGKDAMEKAEAIVCAKSVTLLDDALSGKPVPAPACKTAPAQIEKNTALADSLGFRGTPTLVREDGAVNPGYLSADQLTSWIDGK